MRVAHNPIKGLSNDVLEDPASLTIATVTYIPNQYGYHRESLDVLKLCLASLFSNTSRQFDLVLLDNGSCDEVLAYLTEMYNKGLIHRLLLFRRNVGQVGAWNYLFALAPGEFIGYTDSDVYFSPGWDDRLFEVLHAFPKVGAVSGWGKPHSWDTSGPASTIKIAESDDEIHLSRGQLLPDKEIIEYARSIGEDESIYLARCRRNDQVKIERNGVTALTSHSDWQFLARRDTLQDLLPFHPTGPLMLHTTHEYFSKMDRLGLMKLASTDPVVRHLGNTLTEEWRDTAHELLGSKDRLSGNSPRGKTHKQRWNPTVAKQLLRFALKLSPFRSFLERVYDLLFRVLFLWPR